MSEHYDPHGDGGHGSDWLLWLGLALLGVGVIAFFVGGA